MAHETTLFSQSGYPVFQNRMYASAREACAAPVGDIQIVENQNTGLVYNAAFDPALVVYDENYQNEQGLSTRFHAHLVEVADIIAETMGQQNLVEVGCGKAHFLDMLAGRGASITGFDPAYEGSNPLVRKEYFGLGTPMSADGVIIRHVLEHIQDPVPFLRKIGAANGNRGRVYIEVPCFEWIARNRAWFDIFYEHVNYFRLSDFHRMFGDVVASGHLFGGQYIYAVAELASIRTPIRDSSDPAHLPTDFLQGLDRADDTQAPSVIWGGASKGVIYSLLRMRAGNPVETVIDINPAKQGKFIAGTGLQVETPEAVLERLPEGTRIGVMNSNYLPEIRDQVGRKYQCVGIENV